VAYVDCDVVVARYVDCDVVVAYVDCDVESEFSNLLCL
jgi:hypothetical protein